MKKRTALLLTVLLSGNRCMAHAGNDNLYLMGDQAAAAGDNEKAAEYCALAAEQGNASAQFRRGGMYYLGEGVEQSFEQAFRYFTLAAEQGEASGLRVFADETRPLLQGARLTTYELQKAGIDVTLICDNMASLVMKNGWVQACFVGCDRVAANGDTANKIGTSGVAILAAHYGIPFYVLGPTSSIDLNCPTGADIPIEERDPDEIRTKYYSKAMAPGNVKCFNPAFDVTDHALITAIITEKGIIRPPFVDSLAELNK